MTFRVIIYALDERRQNLSSVSGTRISCILDCRQQQHLSAMRVAIIMGHVLMIVVHSCPPVHFHRSRIVLIAIDQPLFRLWRQRERIKRPKSDSCGQR